MSLVLFAVFIFFFFKQKTAYEMRISDWSSDVCSSDLVRPGPVASASRRTPLALATPRRPFAAAVRVSVGSRSASAAGPRRASPARRSGRPDPRFPAHSAAGTPTKSPARSSSEDYTSEFQSLLRISYGVFCLLYNTQIYYASY